MKMISEFVDGEHVDGQFLIGAVNKGVNANGGVYLSIELRDSTGSITAKKWDATSIDEANFVVGNILSIQGETLKYKDNLQFKIVSYRVLNNEEVDVTRFIQAPPIPKEEIVMRFNRYVESIVDVDCQKILAYMIKKFSNKLFDFPAATTNHHAYASGLLYHTISMADLAEFLCKQYEGINRDLLITGVLLHDMGKCIELEGPVVYKYSIEGKLLGHISIMCSEIREASHALGITSETALLLEHMILSHHGQQEYGSPIIPLTREAFLLSLVDNMDSKIVMMNKALEGVNPGEFSQRVFTLDNRAFYNPKK